MTHRIMAVAVLALASCTGTSSDATVEPVRDAQAVPLAIAFQGLCNATTLAEAGDVQSAADTFLDQSHQFLHEFAARISVSDREAAARLLEAKQVVEAQIAAPENADPPAVAEALAALETVLADTAEGAGFDRPVCGGAP